MTNTLVSCLTVLVVAGSSVEARLNEANGLSAEANTAADSMRIIANTSGTLLSSADATDPCRSAFAVAPQPMQVGALTMEGPKPTAQQGVQLLPASIVVNLPLDDPAQAPPYDVQSSSTEELISCMPNPMFAYDDFDTPFDVQPIPEPATWIAGGIAALIIIVHSLRNCEAMRKCNPASGARFANTSAARAILRLDDAVPDSKAHHFRD